jgi:hypothetical protein
MQKFKILRIVLIGGLLAGAGGLFAITRVHLAFDRDSRIFIKDSVAAIGAHWDTAELLQRATPQFRAETAEAELRAQFAAANATLGPLVDYRAIGAESSFLSAVGLKPPAADYIVRAVFANGEADLVVRAVRAGSTWLIADFTIGASPKMRELLGLQGGSARL